MHHTKKWQEAKEGMLFPEARGSHLFAFPRKRAKKRWSLYEQESRIIVSAVGLICDTESLCHDLERERERGTCNIEGQCLLLPEARVNEWNLSRFLSNETLVLQISFV